MATAAMALAAQGVTSNSATNQVVWGIWNCHYSVIATGSAMTAGSAAASAIWHQWNVVYTGAVTVSNAVTNGAWAAWNDQLLTQYVGEAAANGLSPGEGRRRAEFAERQRVQAARAKAASSRARAELRHWLDEEQWKTFEKQNHFIVHSRDGQRIYLVEYGRSGNVKLISPQGRELASFCIHPIEGEIMDLFRADPDAAINELFLGGHP